VITSTASVRPQSPARPAPLMSAIPVADANLRRWLDCPRCGLSVEVRPHRTAMKHCPRCIARSRLIVELFRSTMPSDALYGEYSLPRVDEESAPVSATSSGKRRRRARAEDNFRRAQPLALVIKRPMAVTPTAIDERAAISRPRPRPAPCLPCPPAGQAGSALGKLVLTTGPVDVPQAHRGMAVAYALLRERERPSGAPVRVDSHERLVKYVAALP
jgi:hypothetical protein